MSRDELVKAASLKLSKELVASILPDENSDDCEIVVDEISKRNNGAVTLGGERRNGFAGGARGKIKDLTLALICVIVYDTLAGYSQSSDESIEKNLSHRAYQTALDYGVPPAKAEAFAQNLFNTASGDRIPEIKML